MCWWGGREYLQLLLVVRGEGGVVAGVDVFHCLLLWFVLLHHPHQLTQALGHWESVPRGFQPLFLLRRQRLLRLQLPHSLATPLKLQLPNRLVIVVGRLEVPSLVLWKKGITLSSPQPPSPSHSFGEKRVKRLPLAVHLLHEILNFHLF